MDAKEITTQNPNTNELLEHALLYASLGWHVFPLHTPKAGSGCSCGKADCERAGKHPWISEWQNQATTNETTIREWWSKYPNANIGILTGEKSGIVVLDIDSNTGTKSLKLLAKLCPDIPHSIAAKTGRGLHLYFAHGGNEMRNKQNILPKIDLRGDGGYVVAPPSLHQSGTKYSWMENRHPKNRKLEVMQDGLVGFIKMPLKDQLKIKEGSRNAHLFRIGAALRGKGMEDDEILKSLLKTNAFLCDPPLSESEVKKIAKSAAKYEPDDSDEKKERISQSQELVALASDFELFHTSDDIPYAAVIINDRKQVLKVKSLRTILSTRYFEKYNRPANAQPLQDAIGVLTGKALYQSEEQRVYTRLAMVGETIYVDLRNEKGEVVQITPAGWDVIINSPVHFVNPNTMLPLARPEKGGRIDELRGFINVKSDDHWNLIVAWLIKAFIPSGAFPILTIQGEQGSAKSTTAKIMKSLVDPAKPILRAPPKNERDLFISAIRSWVLAFDNLSGMPNWVSDALCRLSTSAGFSTRELHTDAEEMIFEAMLPIIINGIEDLATRNDLADRSILLYLTAIRKEERKRESLIMEELEKVKGRILGAVFDAVAVALKNFKTVKLTELPRMADFAHWVVAAEPALPWKAGSFMKAYERNRKEALSICFEVDILASVVSGFVNSKKTWEGTATELLDALKDFDPDDTVNNRSFPKAANQMTNRLRRIAPSLRSEGVDVEEVKQHGKKILKLRLKK